MKEISCVVDVESKNNEKRQVLEKQKLTLERILNRMRHVVETNDAKLYNHNENYFLSLIGSSEYKKILPSQLKAKYWREYHNMPISNKLLFNLIKLNESKKDKSYQSSQSTSFNQVAKDVKNQRKGSYKKTFNEYFPREKRTSRVDIHSLKLALKGEY